MNDQELARAKEMLSKQAYWTLDPGSACLLNYLVNQEERLRNLESSILHNTEPEHD